MKHVRHQDHPPPDRTGSRLGRVAFEGINLRFLEARTGDTVADHGHDMPEELLVLSGRIRQGPYVLGPGDLLRTDAGERHDFEALEDSRFVVVNPRE